jgi:hypothetical protein
MGFLTWGGGWATAKSGILGFTLGMYITAFASTGIAVALPFTAPVTVPLAAWSFTAGDAGGAMLISPIDPITVAVSSVTAVVGGPI